VISAVTKLGCAYLSHSRRDPIAARVGLPYVLFSIVPSQTCVRVMSEWWSSLLQCSWRTARQSFLHEWRTFHLQQLFRLFKLVI